MVNRDYFWQWGLMLVGIMGVWRAPIDVLYWMLRERCLYEKLLLITFWVLSFLFFRSLLVPMNEDRSKINPIVLKKTRQRIRRKQIARSLGFSILYEWCLGHLQVVAYDHFKRPNTWPPNKEYWDRIDRYYFDKLTVEVQYPRKTDNLLIRVTLDNAGNFRDATGGETKMFKYLSWLSLSGFLWNLSAFFKRHSRIVVVNAKD